MPQIRSSLKSAVEEESTPKNRRKWAYAWALRRAESGDSPTVRQVQEATRKHFGRGMGNAEASVVVREVIQAATAEQRLLDQTEEAAESSQPSGPSLMASGKALKVITRLMRESGFRAIEILDDDRISVTPA